MPRANTKKKAATPATLDSVYELMRRIKELDEISDYQDYTSLKLEIYPDETSRYCIDTDSDSFWRDTVEEVVEKLQEIFKYLEDRERNSVKVGTYTAKVEGGAIKVGCQTVTFEQFDKLAALVAEKRPKATAKRKRS